MCLRRARKQPAEACFLRVSERHRANLGEICARRVRCAAIEDRGDEYDKRKAPPVSKVDNGHRSARGRVSDRDRAPDSVWVPAPGRSPAAGWPALASAMAAATRVAVNLARAACL
jgi:hypothetical protein